MKDPLIEKIEGFCEEFNMSESCFCRAAANNPSLMQRLRNGQTITRAKSQEIELFMEVYRDKFADTIIPASARHQIIGRAQLAREHVQEQMANA